MRPNKTRRALGAAALALLALGGCAAGTPSGARHKVAIVAKSTTTEFWLSVFAGAEAAATEYNLELTVAGPETEEDWYSQNRMVAEAVEDGAEALVFSAIDYESNAEAIDEAAARGVRIVAIDSPVNSDAVQTYIGTDNYAAGQMAARAALDGVEGELRVGIVNYDARSANGQERERGALDAFADSGRARVESVINTLPKPAAPRPTPPRCFPPTPASTCCWPSTSPPAWGPPRPSTRWAWRKGSTWWGLIPTSPRWKGCRPARWTRWWCRTPTPWATWGWKAPTGC